MPSRALPRLGIGAAALVLVVLGGAAWLVTRPAVSAASALHSQVGIECSGTTRVSAAACQAWGDAILAADPAPPTFERTDLRRVTIDRSLLGFGACSAAFFILRYPDSPAWSGEVRCR